MIDGFSLSFFLPLVVHALAGLTTGVSGPSAGTVESPESPRRMPDNSSKALEDEVQLGYIRIV